MAVVQWRPRRRPAPTESRPRPARRLVADLGASSTQRVSSAAKVSARSAFRTACPAPAELPVMLGSRVRVAAASSSAARRASISLTEMVRGCDPVGGALARRRTAGRRRSPTFTRCRHAGAVSSGGAVDSRDDGRRSRPGPGGAARAMPPGDRSVPEVAGGRRGRWLCHPAPSKRQPPRGGAHHPPPDGARPGGGSEQRLGGLLDAVRRLRRLGRRSSGRITGRLLATLPIRRSGRSRRGSAPWGPRPYGRLRGASFGAGHGPGRGLVAPGRSTSYVPAP